MKDDLSIDNDSWPPPYASGEWCETVEEQIFEKTRLALANAHPRQRQIIIDRKKEHLLMEIMETHEPAQPLIIVHGLLLPRERGTGFDPLLMPVEDTARLINATSPQLRIHLARGMTWSFINDLIETMEEADGEPVSIADLEEELRELRQSREWLPELHRWQYDEEDGTPDIEPDDEYWLDAANMYPQLPQIHRSIVTGKVGSKG